jgi:CubicO group peptidase (beta-lactamase class C family)
VSLAKIEEILERLVPNAMTANGVPGFAVAAVLGDVELVRCFGVTDVERPVPITPDTLFQVGSIAKSLTAVLVQQLVHEQRLALDVPVTNYLSDLDLADSSVTPKITCRHLLAHLGGFEGDFFKDTGNQADAHARFVAALREAPQLVPFDWLFSYSNAGYAVLGRVVEVLRGIPYEDSALRFVFEPLGLSRTSFAWETPEPPVATGHVLHDGVRPVRPWRLFRSYAAWGGLVMSVRDFLSYARFYLGHHGAKVLAGAERERLWEPLYPPEKSPWSMGWLPAQRIGSLRLLRSGGTAVSQNASLLIAPEESFAMVVLTNGDQGGRVGAELSWTLLTEQFGLSEPKATSPVVVAADRLAQYVGNYRAAIYAIEIGFDGDGIWLDAERVGGMDAHQTPRPAPLPRMRLDFVGDDRAIIHGGPFAGLPVHFVRHDDGTVKWVRFYGRLTPRAT